MSTVTIIALLVLAFIVGFVVGVFVVAVCVAGAREDAWRHDCVRGLHSDRPSQVTHHTEEVPR